MIKYEKRKDNSKWTEIMLHVFSKMKNNNNIFLIDQKDNYKWKMKRRVSVFQIPSAILIFSIKNFHQMKATSSNSTTNTARTIPTIAAVEMPLFVCGTVGGTKSAKGWQCDWEYDE